MEKALIVGLGNPGTAYRLTRHNIGFEAIDELAKAVGASWADSRRKYLIAQALIDGCNAALIKPQTFMNLSGEAVSACARKYGISPERIIVVHDDIDLALGKVRIKFGGGDGGHKGVRSIAQSLGSKLFKRVRLGIGRPPLHKSAEEFVLERFQAAEKPAVLFLVEQGAEAARLLLTQDCEYVQNVVHAKKFCMTKADASQDNDFSLATDGVL
ncbi:MAG: aminoacyl-tRNA hydrolase [Desulfomonilaceae bacterium]